MATKAAERMTVAIERSLERLGTAYGHVLESNLHMEADATDDIFAPLGETLMWLIAFDEFLKEGDEAAYPGRRRTSPDGRVLQGLRLARHAIAHGVAVLDLALAHRGGVLPATLPMFLGVAPDCVWVPRARLPPSRPAKDLVEREASYDTDVAGMEILDPLGRGFRFLRSEAGT
jgi:hypothetical protein